MPTDDEWRSAAVTAVETYLQTLGNDMSVGRFVLLVEAFDVEGDQRVIYQSVGEDQTVWDTMGLLEYAKANEQAQLVAHRVNGE